MKHLALTWTDGNDCLEKFDFVFHVTLKSVRDQRCIEDIILQQHAGLLGNSVTVSEIKTILEDPEQRVLLILDGHDEYKPGTNQDIDDAIRKKQLRHCWIVITSRENKDLPSLRDYFDAEAELLGFDKENIEEYIAKYLGDKGKCQELIKIAKKCGLIKSYTWNSLGFGFHDYGVMCIPILLHMICVLFQRKVSLPQTKTGILSAMVERCPDWEEIRKSGKKTEKDIESILVMLGSFVLEKLQYNGSQTFEKVKFSKLFWNCYWVFFVVRK